MELNLCCDRTPELKHDDDFSEYWFECPECNTASNNKENPKDAAIKWNLINPSGEHFISGHPSKFPAHSFIEVANKWVDDEELEYSDIEFDDPVVIEKRSASSDCAYVRCWIIINEDEVKEHLKESDDSE